MTIHFEELWDKCEELHKQIDRQESQSILIDELMMKLNLYKALDSHSDLPSDELEKVKSRTMGEILLTLTHLSLKGNINVFEALATAYKYRSIGHLNEKY